MSFKSVNEVHALGFDDCEVQNITVNENYIEIELEALIIRANNSKNENFTDSYADTTRFTMKNARITSMCKAGYKQYDANNVLIHEESDQIIEADKINDKLILIKSTNPSYLYKVDSTQNDNDLYCVTLFFEVPIEGEIAPDIYELGCEASSLEFVWNKYLNRVQK